MDLLFHTQVLSEASHVSFPLYVWCEWYVCVLLCGICVEVWYGMCMVCVCWGRLGGGDWIPGYRIRLSKTSPSKQLQHKQWLGADPQSGLFLAMTRHDFALSPNIIDGSRVPQGTATNSNYSWESSLLSRSHHPIILWTNYEVFLYPWDISNTIYFPKFKGQKKKEI